MLIVSSLWIVRRRRALAANSVRTFQTRVPLASVPNAESISSVVVAFRQHQAAIFLGSGDFGASPLFFGQHLVKLISSTAH
jgi:hypothetical protein